MDQEQVKTFMTDYARNYNERRERHLRRLKKNGRESVVTVLIGIIIVFSVFGTLIYEMLNIGCHVTTGVGFPPSNTGCDQLFPSVIQALVADLMGVKQSSQ